MTDRTPDYLLELLHAGALPPDREAEVRARLAAEVDGAARIEALRSADEQFLAAHPPEVVLPAVRNLAAVAPAAPGGVRPWRPSRVFAVAATLAAAVVVVVLARPAVDERPATPELEQTRLKGARPSLSLFRRTATGSERLKSGATVRPGDELQLSYTAAGLQYGAIVSVDGAGGVSRHFPSESGTTELESGGSILLDHAFELDDAPGFERFFFVASDDPINPRDIERRLASGLPPVEGDSVEIVVVEVKKETDP